MCVYQSSFAYSRLNIVARSRGDKEIMLSNIESHHKTILSVLELTPSEISHEAHIKLIKLAVDNLFEHLIKELS
jgi:hypothetical protein